MLRFLFLVCLSLVSSVDKDSELFDRIHEKKHIISDIRNEFGNAKEGMSDLELDTYFFNLHDYNRDERLDGVELMKSYLSERLPNGERYPDEILEHSIDYVLLQADMDGDRYLDFGEFRNFTVRHRQEYLAMR